MNKFFWLFLAVTTSCLVNIPSQALPTPRTESTNTKSSVRIIPQSKATGTQAQLQTVEVWPGHGVSVSFYETGEVIQRVWLDDPSRILMDVDGCLQGLSDRSNCKDSGAGLIHLRQINPVSIPGMPTAKNGAHLTVITQSSAGTRQVYNFRVLTGKGTPRYSTISITPDVTRKEAPPADSIIVTSITRGLQVAAEKRWITPSNPLWQKLQQLIQELQSGKNLTSAAESVKVSPQLIERLLQLGSESTAPNQVPNQKVKPTIQRNQDFSDDSSSN
jgi:hypothetical protein